MNMTPDETLLKLLHSGSQLPSSELNSILRAIWPQLRAPQQSHHGTELVGLFQRAGYVSDGLPRPDSELTIYRGELASATEPGISWTADLQIAKQYARNYATLGDTRVIQATAQPEAVLARFHQEAEVVVAPDLLKDVKELGYIPHFTLPRLTPF